VFRFEPDYRWQLAGSGSSMRRVWPLGVNWTAIVSPATVPLLARMCTALPPLVDERAARAVAESGAMRMVARVVGNGPREDDARARVGVPSRPLARVELGVCDSPSEAFGELDTVFALTFDAQARAGSVVGDSAVIPP
jgi:hypothetical protein